MFSHIQCVPVRGDDFMEQFDLFSTLWARINVNCKGIFHPRTVHEDPERENNCISTLFLPLALDRMSG
jgi:hypothetical protein